ncbi:hypothetical protein PS1_032657 [Malus domestica]
MGAQECDVEVLAAIWAWEVRSDLVFYLEIIDAELIEAVETRLSSRWLWICRRARLRDGSIRTRCRSPCSNTGTGSRVGPRLLPRNHRC